MNSNSSSIIFFNFASKFIFFNLFYYFLFISLFSISYTFYFHLLSCLTIFFSFFFWLQTPKINANPRLLVDIFFRLMLLFYFILGSHAYISSLLHVTYNLLTCLSFYPYSLLLCFFCPIETFFVNIFNW